MKLVTFGSYAFNVGCWYYVGNISSLAININKTRAFSTDRDDTNNLNSAKDNKNVGSLTKKEVEEIWGIVPIVIYSNAETQKAAIIKENKKKSGIYMWINNENKKIYVGSAADLTKRFYMYCSLKHLVGAKNSLICKALIKYGYSCFSFIILEYCDKIDVVKREQYYIDTLNPEYNLAKIAGSSLGVIRSEETKAKIDEARSKLIHSEDTKNKIAAAILGRKHTKESVEKMRNRIISEETLIKVRKHLSELNKNKRISVEVIDTEINITTEYKSIKLAAQALNADATTLSRYLKSQKLYQKRYRIVKKYLT